MLAHEQVLNDSNSILHCYQGEAEVHQRPALTATPVTLVVNIMTLQKILFLIPTIATMISCTTSVYRKQENKKTRVAHFGYGGYGDTICATLIGHVFILDTSIHTKDSLSPVSAVKVAVQEKDTTLFTDAGGQFVIPLYSGLYSFLMTKDGYQPLLLANFVSDPDQYSDVVIYLEKGQERQTYKIPKWTR